MVRIHFPPAVSPLRTCPTRSGKAVLDRGRGALVLQDFLFPSSRYRSRVTCRTESAADACICLAKLTGPRRPGALYSCRSRPLIRDDVDRALSARHHTAVRPFIEFLALWTSSPPPCRDAAVSPFVEFLALRTSHPPPRRDAAVRAFVELLALRTSHPPPCRDAAIRAFVELLALRTSHPAPCCDAAVRSFEPRGNSGHLRYPRFHPAGPQAACQGVDRELNKPPVGNAR
jgi:hypothetical protein